MQVSDQYKRREVSRQSTTARFEKYSTSWFFFFKSHRLHPSSDSDKVPGPPTAQHPPPTPLMVTKHLAFVNTELNILRPLAHLIPATVREMRVMAFVLQKRKLPPGLGEWFWCIHRFPPLPGDGRLLLQIFVRLSLPQSFPHVMCVCLTLNHCTLCDNIGSSFETLSPYRIPFSTGSDSCPLKNLCSIVL